MIEPAFILTGTSPATTADWKGNGKLNSQHIIKFLPKSALKIYNGNASDNANDALKETDETWRLLERHHTNESNFDALYANGVRRRCFKHRDPFHIHQLIIKHLSEASFGKTTKGDHEENHHRQVIATTCVCYNSTNSIFYFDLKMMQVIWDIYDRDRDVFMSIAREILGDIKDWIPKPMKEKDTRWLTNGRLGGSILIGCMRMEHASGSCWQYG